MKTIHLPALQTQMYLSGSIQVSQEAATYVNHLNTSKIEASENTPSVHYQKPMNLLSISGIINSAQAIGTMKTAMNMVNSHFKSYESLSLVLNITKINASGVKMLMNLLSKLQNYLTEGKKVKVVWNLNVHDEDLVDLASDMINLYGINMRLRYH